MRFCRLFDPTAILPKAIRLVSSSNMKIETIQIRNYRALKAVKLTNVPGFCVIIGANGSGKSTLFDVFHFLQDALKHTVSKALQSRGGFHEVITRECCPDESIDIEIQFRMEINGVSRLVTYQLIIGYHQHKVFVKKEILRYKRGAYGSPFHFLEFSAGKGFAINNEEDFNKPDEELEREQQVLDTPDTLAIKGVGQFQRFKAANAFKQLIENWHISDFHINSARGSKDSLGFDQHLSASGDNLQLVANHIREHYPKVFTHIIQHMRRRVPGIGDIQTESTVDGRLLLKFHDGSFRDPFIDKYVSDGTLKMFAYLILLNDPETHPILCVEEPENQLYPKLLAELAEEFASYSERGGQVFVSSHSPDFINAIDIDSVFWLEKKHGYTRIKRAKDDDQIVAYVKDDETLGKLWQEGWMGEVDPC